MILVSSRANGSSRFGRVEPPKLLKYYCSEFNSCQQNMCMFVYLSCSCVNYPCSCSVPTLSFDSLPVCVPYITVTFPYWNYHCSCAPPCESVSYVSVRSLTVPYLVRCRLHGSVLVGNRLNLQQFSTNWCQKWDSWWALHEPPVRWKSSLVLSLKRWSNKMSSSWKTWSSRMSSFINPNRN